MGIERSKWLKWWKIAVTFHLVCFAWIFFRCKNVEEGIYIIKNIIKIPEQGFDIHSAINYIRDSVMLEQSSREVIVLFLVILFLVVVGVRYKKNYITELLIQQKIVYRWSVYCLLIISIILFSIYGNSGFIYYNF